MTDVESNKALDRRFVDEVLNQHDLDALTELVAEDFVEQNPPPGQGPGREGLRQFLAQMFEAFPDLRWRIEEAVAARTSSQPPRPHEDCPSTTPLRKTSTSWNPDSPTSPRTSGSSL